MRNSSIGQAFILLLLSLIFAFGYNGIRRDGLQLVAVKDIVRSDDVSDVDIFLSDTAFFVAPRMLDLALAKQLYDRGVVFVDARDQEEYRNGHIAGSLNGSVVQLASRLGQDDPVVVYCSGEGCNESLNLAETLMMPDWGFTRVFVFDGGWPEWKAAGYPAEEVR